MAFTDQTSSFFDELSEILDQKKRVRDEGINIREDRPFSALLTQDEEPDGDGNPASLELEEPEVVIRGG